MAWLVVSLMAPYIRTRGESWKEPARYLPLILLNAKPSQGPTLAKATQLGLRRVAAPLLGDQRSNDRQQRPSQLCPSTLGADRALIWEVCILVEKSSSLPEHFLFHFQST